MPKNPFLVLGVDSNCTQNELFDAYKDLRNKYSNLRFADGEEGANACTMLEEIEVAYREASNILRENASKEKQGGFDYNNIETEIKNKNYDKAQEMLDDISNRDARWHYLQSVIFYQKKWYSDSLKQLEFACSLDTNNTKYQEARQALYNKINANSANKEGSFYQNNNNNTQQNANAGQQRTYSRYNGAGGRQAGVCDCCSSLICADCCCECMGGDLISCC